MLNARDKKVLEGYKAARSYKADCCICGGFLDPNAEDTEMSKPKSGGMTFFHRGCVKKWGE